jgi:hypothetical protein
MGKLLLLSLFIPSLANAEIDDRRNNIRICLVYDEAVMSCREPECQRRDITSMRSNELPYEFGDVEPPQTFERVSDLADLSLALGQVVQN